MDRGWRAEGELVLAPNCCDGGEKVNKSVPPSFFYSVYLTNVAFGGKGLIKEKFLGSSS